MAVYDPLCDDMVVARYGIPEPAAHPALSGLASALTHTLSWGVWVLLYALVCLIGVAVMLAFAADCPEGAE